MREKFSLSSKIFLSISALTIFQPSTSSSLRLSDNYDSPESHSISSSSNVFSPSDQLILLDDDLLPNYNHDSTNPHIYAVTSKYFYSGEGQDVCLYFTNFPELKINQHFKIAASLTNHVRPVSSWNNQITSNQRMEPSKVIFVKKVKQKLGQKKCFRIKVPEVESDQVFRLTFTVKYGLNTEVNAQNLIKIRPSFPVVFITTDKPIYKAGQTVRYKVLVLDRHMKPFRRSLKPHLVEVSVKNPQNTKLDSKSSGIWLDQYGMYSGDFNLIEDPSVGEWTLGVQLQAVKSAVAKVTTYKTKFSVQKYNLPKFNMQITAPKTLYFNEANFQFTICGKYTHGKPFQGSAKATVRSETSSWHYVSRHQNFPEFNIQLDDKTGCAEFTVPSDKLHISASQLQFANINLHVNATLTEKGSGEQMTKTWKNTRVIDVKYQMKVSDDSSNSFIPGLEEVVKLSLFDSNSAPAKKVRVLAVQNDRWTADPSSADKCEILTTNKKGEIEQVLPSSFTGTVQTFLFKHIPENSNFSCSDSKISFRSWDMQHSISLTQSPNGAYLKVTKVDESNLKISLSFDEISNMTSASIYRVDIVQGSSMEPKLVTEIKIDSTSKIFSSTINVKDSKSFPASQTSFIAILPDNQLLVTPIDGQVSEREFVTSKLSLPNAKSLKPSDMMNARIESPVAGARCAIKIVDESVRILGKVNGKHQAELDFDAIEKFGINPYKIPSSTHDLESDTICVNELGDDPTIKAGFQVFRTRNTNVPCRPKMIAISANPQPDSIIISKYGVPSDMSEIAVRNYMPETWLWETVTTNKNGIQVMKNLKVPDTITSWSASMFCISREGLSLAKLSSIQVSKPFFTEIKLPVSAVRFEKIRFPVQIFNNQNKKQNVHLTIQVDSKFMIVNQDVDPILRQFEVDSFDIHTEYFEIEVVGIGAAKITAYLISLNDRALTDAVEARMKIRAEGLEKEFTSSKLVCHDSRGDDTVFSLIDRPPKIHQNKIIPNSIRTRVSIIDDLLGPALENLDNLINIPSGCGEQTMIDLVPNIFVANYLKEQRGSRRNDPLRAKAVNNAKTGYQKELNFQRDDGSFSAFGNSDASGSSWLTGFVMRSFAEASEFIHVDPVVMHRAKNWLTGTQDPVTGCFPIHGMVLDKTLLKNHESSELFMTTVALTALYKFAQVPQWNEANYVPTESGIVRTGADEKLSQSMAQALQCITRHRNKYNDFNTYTLAQLLYAANLIGKTELYEEVFRIVEKREIEPNRDFLYWSAKSDGNQDSNKIKKKLTNAINPNGAKRPGSHEDLFDIPAADIETTSYVLLSSLGQRAAQRAGYTVFKKYRTMRWLQSQRNERGGWSSTQNTMVALAALTRYAASFRPEPSSFVLNFAGRSHSVTDKTFKKTHRVDFNGTADLKNIKFSGKGCALVQASIKYNVENPRPLATDTLDLKVMIKSEIGGCTVSNGRRVAVYCAKTRGHQTNMAIFDVELPTGYSISDENLQKAQKFGKLMGLSKFEQKFPGRISFYFDQLDSNDRCVPLDLEYDSNVRISGAQNPSFTVYDYYDDDIAMGTLYSMECTDETHVDPSNDAIGCLKWGENGNCIQICHELDWRNPNKCYEAIVYNEDLNTNICEVGNNVCENGKCIYTFYGYRCACNAGYEMNIYGSFGEACRPIQAGDSDLMVQGGCQPNSCSGGSCKPKGKNGFMCVCDPGFKRDSGNPNVCKDVNECEISKKCAGTNEICLNLVGSYECMCAAGFQRNSDSECIDINECNELNPGRKHDCGDYEECVNVAGGYECKLLEEFDDLTSNVDCAIGYKNEFDGDLNDWICVDINECDSNELNTCAKVSKICANIPGSYQCLEQVDAN